MLRLVRSSEASSRAPEKFIILISQFALIDLLTSASDFHFLLTLQPPKSPREGGGGGGKGEKEWEGRLDQKS